MKIKIEKTEAASLHLLLSFFSEDPSCRQKDKQFFVEVINSLITQDGNALYLRREQMSLVLQILNDAAENLPSGDVKSIGGAVRSLRMKLINELTEDQESETLGTTNESE